MLMETLKHVGYVRNFSPDCWSTLVLWNDKHNDEVTTIALSDDRDMQRKTVSIGDRCYEPRDFL